MTDEGFVGGVLSQSEVNLKKNPPVRGGGEEQRAEPASTSGSLRLSLISKKL